MTDQSGRLLSSIDHVLHEVFGFSEFRPRQRDVCLSAWRGNDVLLVMPTGAGKSLCYQLPTVARVDGRALVVSPLIALIEDQVGKLRALGIAADRIHSGRSRPDSWEACRQWRAGQLQFLFVAPERLGVPGFLDFLEEHKPALIAVDEAHCISMWGHDFRADYRQLGPRLARLRPANIVALTATATPEVQRDIVDQLNLKRPDIFIHGFRRKNIAIDVMEITPGARTESLIEVLKDQGRLPAIVYAPTRKIAESTAAELKDKFTCGVFHAGMPTGDRQTVQDAFLGGSIDVMVATIAFGMGVDKANVRTVIHLAMPGSVEGYYQEIGRAGRDGQLCHAILMYAPIDRKTHDYFLELNYPDPAILERVLDAVKQGSSDRDEVVGRLGLSPDIVKSALEKLLIHGGIRVGSEHRLETMDGLWERSYLRQRRHRVEQLAKAFSFAQSKVCRMLNLIHHFGDRDDSEESCGICDVCRGPSSATKMVQQLITEDQTAQETLLEGLIPFQSKTSGNFFREMFEPQGWSRRRFEGIVWDLEAKGLLFQSAQSFTKNGKQIDYSRIGLTDDGRAYLHDRGRAPSVSEQRKKIEDRQRSSTRKSKARKRSYFASLK